MKGFIISLGIAAFLVVLFLGGIFASSTVPTFAAFCMWSPAMIAIGWTARGINKRLVLVDKEQPKQSAVATSPLLNNNNLSRLQPHQRTKPQLKNEDAI